jgi:hypothetical protein
MSGISLLCPSSATCQLNNGCVGTPGCPKAPSDGRLFPGSFSEVPAPTPASQRRVVCAAIRAADGDLLLGIRHYSADMHAQIEQRMDGQKFTHRHDQDQGFVDQHGRYLTREEAYAVAAMAGQITRPHACGNGLDGPKLYSEGLY